MCGICGFTGNFNGADKVIEKMMDSIAHRGPDSHGKYIGENIYLGYRRLSIIDIESGAQPLYNEDKTIALVFNGEIYNYKSLREELIAKGHVFSCNADSEVLVHGYEEYGENMLDKLRGMFAFVIYDSNNNNLFAARDHFGIKPFYYACLDGELVFASEIKAILEHPNYKKELNLLALENYLTFQYSVLEESFFKGIYKLMPAHSLKFFNGNIEINRYWSPTLAPMKECSLEAITQEIEAVLEDSIEAHKVSDVEVGSFLSSGVDSSYVAARFNGNKTFSVGFDYDKYNEIEYAKELSKGIGIENYNKTITTEEFWQILPKVQYHMDEPLADAAAVALYFVSRLAREHVKVSLSGEGADELFGGYNIYKEPLDLKIITDLPLGIRRFLGFLASLIPFNIKGKNFLIRASKTVEQRFIGNAFIFSKAEREAILKTKTGKYDPSALTRPFYEDCAHLDDITKMQYIDIHFWLIGDILLKADKMSMANSLEVRVPFLDKEVFKIASKIPTNFKVNKTSTKYAFRMVAKKVLPQDTAARRKLGFPVPIRIWLRQEKYYNLVKEAFNSETAQNYFNSNKLTDLLNRHKKGKVDYSRKIWTIYMFLVWHKIYFEN